MAQPSRGVDRHETEQNAKVVTKINGAEYIQGAEGLCYPVQPISIPPACSDGVVETSLLLGLGLV